MKKIVALLAVSLAVSPVFAQTSGRQVPLNQQTLQDSGDMSTFFGKNPLNDKKKAREFSERIRSRMTTEKTPFSEVKGTLDSFRNLREQEKEENAGHVLQGILTIADAVFEQYAKNPDNKAEFTAKDPAAFEIIKKEINKPVKVGWQKKRISIREYINNHTSVIYSWTSVAEQNEIFEFARILE